MEDLNTSNSASKIKSKKIVNISRKNDTERKIIEEEKL